MVFPDLFSAMLLSSTELTSEDYTFCIDFLGRYFGFDFLSVAMICCPGNLFVGGLPYVYFQPVSEISL